MCSATGEKSFQSFDGTLFQFNGKCEYTLLKLGDIRVDITNIMCKDYGVVCSKQVKIHVDTLTISMARGMDLMVGSVNYPDYEYT